MIDPCTGVRIDRFLAIRVIGSNYFGVVRMAEDDDSFIGIRIQKVLVLRLIIRFTCLCCICNRLRNRNVHFNMVERLSLVPRVLNSLVKAYIYNTSGNFLKRQQIVYRISTIESINVCYNYLLVKFI